MIWASLFMLLLSAQGEASSRPPPLPFWKAKEKIYRRIEEDRAIIVAVHTDPIRDGERLVINGGGQISAPIAFAFAQAMNFDNLKQITDYIQEVRSKNGQLFIKSKAFGYEASMWFQVKSTPSSGIHFKVVRGTLKGLQGDFHFDKVNSVKTEIGISGQYDYVKFPIAKIFAEFGIEVVLQRMAIRLRDLVEERYQATLKEVRANG